MRNVDRTHDTNVAIHSRYPIVGTGLQELAGENFLDGQHHAITASDSNRRAAVLDCLDGVFDLEVAPVRGEDGVGEVVAGPDGRLSCKVSNV